MPQSYPGKYGKTPTAIPSTPMAAASLPRRDLLLVWRIQKRGNHPARMGTWECYRTDVTGVSCYSSKDLLNWKFEGIVLPAVKDDEKHDLHPSKVLERPKVIYNEKTKKFVMWAHVESATTVRHVPA